MPLLEVLTVKEKVNRMKGQDKQAPEGVTEGGNTWNFTWVRDGEGRPVRCKRAKVWSLLPTDEGVQVCFGWGGFSLSCGNESYPSLLPSPY